jgi:hypothetical protein
MNCLSYRLLTPKEKTEFIGQLLHVVQSDEYSFSKAKKIIQRATTMGVLNDVKFPDVVKRAKLMSLLSEVTDTSIVGLSIQLAVSGCGDQEDLIKTLKDQAIDNAEVIKQIIGIEAYELLQTA